MNGIGIAFRGDLVKVKMVSEVGKLILHFELEEMDNPKPSENFQMGSNIVTTIFPDDLDINSIHPDLLGLSCILICEPFIGKEITLPKPVSKKFFEGHSKVTSRYKINNVDEKLIPRRVKDNFSPGLAFSGGVDSTAALSIMPHSTIPVFMDRPLTGSSLYNKDAAYRSCLEVSRLGYDMKIIESDLEYVRDPVGFPVDVANSVPAILMADYLKLDSIAFGTIMEATYGVGHKKYRDYPNGNHYTHVGGMFAAAGIPFNLPVAGISEVGTSIIVEKSPLGFIAQSCIRGSWGSPCKNCWKCFRKIILDSAIQDVECDEDLIKNIFRNNEALRFVSGIPIKHENVLTWATNKLEIDNELFSLLKKRVRGDTHSFSWMNKWFPESEIVLHEKYRDEIKQNIARYLETMTEEECGFLREWTMEDMIASDQTTLDRDNLVSKMKKHIKSHQ